MIAKNDFFKYIYNLIYEYLLVNKQASTGELLDNIIYKEMILNHVIEKIDEKNIIKFLENNFNFKDGEWTIK